MKNPMVHVSCDNRLHAVKHAFQEKKSYMLRLCYKVLRHYTPNALA